MEALLHLLLNLFAICVLNKISCAKLLSTLVALLRGSGSGMVMPSPWMAAGLQMVHSESLTLRPQPGSHGDGLFGIQVPWAEEPLQILEGRS